MVYGLSYDSAIKMTMKGTKRTASELLELPSFAEALSTIQAQLDEEMGRKFSEESAPVAPEDQEMQESAKDDMIDDSILERMTATAKVKVEAFKASAAEAVRRQVRLIPEPDSQTKMASILKDSLAGSENDKENSKKVIIVYDSKLAGEAGTHPHIRRPPFRDQHYSKVMGGVIMSRSNPKAIHTNDVYVILDGGTHGPWPSCHCFLLVLVGLFDSNFRMIQLARAGWH